MNWEFAQYLQIVNFIPCLIFTVPLTFIFPSAQEEWVSAQYYSRLSIAITWVDFLYKTFSYWACVPFTHTSHTTFCYHLQVTKCGILEHILNWVKFKAQAQLNRKGGAKTSKLKGIPKLDDANEAGTKSSEKWVGTEYTSLKQYHDCMSMLSLVTTICLIDFNACLRPWIKPTFHSSLNWFHQKSF